MQIQPLGWLLELEGMGVPPYHTFGYIEVILQIPGIKNYDEDVLLLAVPTMTYSAKVLVMVGSKIIDQFCEDITMQIQPLGRLLELEGMGVPPYHTLGT